MDEELHTRGAGTRPSGLLAMGVVLAAVLGWWVFSGNGPQGPSGNDARYAVPDVEVTATDPGASSSPQPALPGTLRIDSYVPRDALRLTLNYRSTPRCSAALGTPRVIENDASVTITLSLAEQVGPCAEDAERHTLGVLLDSPLDGRALLDGSTSPRVRVEPTATAYE